MIDLLLPEDKKDVPFCLIRVACQYEELFLISMRLDTKQKGFNLAINIMQISELEFPN